LSSPRRKDDTYKIVRGIEEVNRLMEAQGCFVAVVDKTEVSIALEKKGDKYVETSLY